MIIIVIIVSLPLLLILMESNDRHKIPDNSKLYALQSVGRCWLDTA